MELHMRNFNVLGLIARIRLALLVMLALAIAGCGGGGGGGSSSSADCPTAFSSTCATSGGTTGGTTTATPAQLSLLLSTPTIQTDGSAEVTISATVKDSKNAIISGATVNFSVDSGTLLASSATTGANGVATVAFNSNDNKTNRTVSITAIAGTLAPVTTTLVVQGTRLNFGGDSAAVRGKTVAMTVSLLDGAGKAVVGQRISLTSKLGNPIPSAVTTDTNGQANISFTASVAGTDTITASALGTALTQEVAVSAVDFAFTSPAAGTLLTISNCHPVTVQLNGVSATSAVFSTSRGQVFATSNCSAGSDLQTVAFSGGLATAYVKSTSAGAATVLAELSGLNSAGRTSLPVNFVATVPQTIIVQSDPSVVAVNGSSSVTALVKDVDGNPVAGKTVFFTASGGGVPSPTTAITNDAGVANTTFKADASISGKDSVVITASVAGVATSGTTTLTVAGKAVNIVIGTDNLIVDVSNPPRFRKVWGVLVSDPASGPIRNQVVTISLRGIEYDKGYYSVVEVDQVKRWVKQSMATCLAEDANNNGFVDPGEVGDLDLDGTLEPNGAAIVRSTTSTGGLSATVTTDDSGAAEFWVEYPRDYGSWAKVELVATATVSGTNSSANRTFYLPVPSTELSDVNVSPSFVVSPFGQRASCTQH